MRVVVTGATGNVGTAVIRALRDDPAVEAVVGIARRSPGDGAPGAGAAEDVRYVTADVRHDDLETHFSGADAVVHLAWLFQPSHRPVETWRANVLGTERVLRAVVAADVPAIVHASSIGAYAAAPDDGRPVAESWPTHSLPTAAYGREKAYAERLLDLFEREQSDRRVVRLRPAFIFQRAAATEQRRLFAGPFVPNALAGWARPRVLPVPSDLRFQTLHADDVADAYRRAVVSDARGAFNVAAEPVIDADVLAEVLDVRVIEAPRRLVRAAVATAWHLHLAPAEPALFDLFLQLPVMDCGRIRRELGWEPRHSARATLRAFLQGMAAGTGGPTEPLAADGLGRRVHEVATGVGVRP